MRSLLDDLLGWSKMSRFAKLVIGMAFLIWLLAINPIHVKAACFYDPLCEPTPIPVYVVETPGFAELAPTIPESGHLVPTPPAPSPLLWVLLGGALVGGGVLIGKVSLRR